MPADPCGHYDAALLVGSTLGPPPRSDGCGACLRAGSTWLHLRRCLACGEVACCDGSPNRHARAHAAAVGHPLVQSFEPGEDWVWCYPDDAGFHVPGVVDSPSHP